MKLGSQNVIGYLGAKPVVGQYLGGSAVAGVYPPVPVFTPYSGVDPITDVLGNPTAIAAAEAQMGIASQIILAFGNLTDANPYYTNNVNAITRTGKMLMLTYVTPNVANVLTDIVAGVYDAKLQAICDLSKSNDRVILRWFHEMNIAGSGSTWHWQPANYIAMWQYIWNFFRSRGNNLPFAWTPNIRDIALTANTETTQYFPGASYVNYMGLDGYRTPGDTRPFVTQFYRAVEELKTLPGNLPIMISEMGADPAATGRVQYLQDAEAYLKVEKRIRYAVNYWNRSPYTLDDAPSAAAYKHLVDALRTDAATVLPSLTTWAAGRTYFAWDGTDLTTMFTNAAGTTPAVVNDLIQCQKDLSPSLRHFTETTNPPTLKSISSILALDWDGTNDKMRTASGAIVGAGGEWAVAAFVRPDKVTGTQTILDADTGSGAGRGLIFRLNAAAVNAIAFATGGVNPLSNTAGLVVVPGIALVASATFNGTTMKAMAAGVGAESVAMTGTPNLSASALSRGASNAATPGSFYDGSDTRMIMLAGPASQADLDFMHSWVQLKAA